MDNIMNSILGYLLNSFREWASWKGFRKLCFFGFLFVTFVDLSVAHLFNQIFHPPVVYRSTILILSYLVPFAVYFFIFLTRRLYLKLFFSRKINVVFAYNLEGVDPTNFSTRYNTLISDIKNQISTHDLGRKIKVIICPPDVKLKEKTAAEAKTRLNLLGSTLLVWGYVSELRGIYKFNTLFSYEFGHPSNLKKEQAKKSFGDFIQKILDRGLFSSTKLNIDNFNDQLLPTVYFILGSCAFSLKIYDRAEVLFESFRTSYNQQDIMRKKDLGPALAEVEEFLIAIYLHQIESRLLRKKDDSMGFVKRYAEKILDINRFNYSANIALAFYYAELNNFVKAKEYTLTAEADSSSRNQDAHRFNNALLLLLENDYDRAIKTYELIPEYPSVTIPQISEFLGNKYESTENPIFQFAYGYVNFKWGDKKEGKKYLNRFFKEQQNNESFQRLFIESRKLIKLKK